MASGDSSGIRAETHTSEPHSGQHSSTPRGGSSYSCRHAMQRTASILIDAIAGETPAGAGTYAVRDGGRRAAAPGAHVPYETGTVVSANAACSGTSKRATPTAFVVTVPAAAYSPSPVAFQIRRLNSVPGGRLPMLYDEETPFGSVSAPPFVSRPRSVIWPSGPSYAAISCSGWSRCGLSNRVSASSSVHGSTPTTSHPRPVVSSTMSIALNDG